MEVQWDIYGKVWHYNLGTSHALVHNNYFQESATDNEQKLEDKLYWIPDHLRIHLDQTLSINKLIHELNIGQYSIKGFPTLMDRSQINLDQYRGD